MTKHRCRTTYHKMEVKEHKQSILDRLLGRVINRMMRQIRFAGVNFDSIIIEDKKKSKVVHDAILQNELRRAEKNDS